MDIKEYVNQKKELYSLFLEILENEEEVPNEEKIQDFYSNTKNYFAKLQEDENHTELILFLRLINKIAENYHRSSIFVETIKSVLSFFSKEIKQTLSNQELFEIFQRNKLILHFLFKSELLQIDQYVLKYIKSNPQYEMYFYQEIKNILNPEERTNIDSKIREICSYSNAEFEEKCKQGNNDSYICSLIRDDSIEEFIAYINQKSISLTSQIERSFFETNLFLLENDDTSFIEYAAFYGSIQIFNYLRFNKVEMMPKLWLYAIHSKNAEIIQILEENKVEPYNIIPEKKPNDGIDMDLFNFQMNFDLFDNYGYDECFKEAVKCHHNDIADYILNNLMNQSNANNNNFNEEISQVILDCFNYKYYPDSFNKDYLFFNLCNSNQYKIVNLFIKMNEKDIQDEIDKEKIFKRLETKINNTAIFYYYLMRHNSIQQKLIEKFRLHLKYVVIPPSVTSLEKMAFKEFWFKQISIPTSLTSIEYNCFSCCSSMTRIEIPSSVTSISDSCFYGCKNVEEIVIPTSVNEIGCNAFFLCTSLKQIIIPYSVTAIKEGTFCGCSSIEQIIIPLSVTSIGENSFSGCSSLKQITIPASIELIKQKCLSGCSSLTQITIPSSVTLIEEGAFSGCLSLKLIKIPSSVKILKRGCFYNCTSLEHVEFESPSSLNEIEKSAFSSCSSLVQISIPSAVKFLHGKVFYECSSLTNVEIQSPITEIKKYTFYNCTSLKQITIPSSIKLIKKYSFEGCSSLLHVMFETPSSLQTIDEQAFYKCSSLVQMLLPSSVKSIGKKAFNECNSLTDIEIPPSVSEIGLSVFSGVTKINITGNTKTIPISLFAKCTNLTQITISASVTSIEDSAFDKCSSLAQVEIPSSVKSIKDFVFSDCSALSQVTFQAPSSLTSIGKCVFNRCLSLKRITIPSSIKKIGAEAFFGCTSLEELSIPSSYKKFNMVHHLSLSKTTKVIKYKEK